MNTYLNLLKVPFTTLRDSKQTLIDWDRCISDNIRIPITFNGKTGNVNVLERRGHLLRIAVHEIFPGISMWISDIDLLHGALTYSVIN